MNEKNRIDVKHVDAAVGHQSVSLRITDSSARPSIIPSRRSRPAGR
jgi:hypothetical protein